MDTSEWNRRIQNDTPKFQETDKNEPRYRMEVYDIYNKRLGWLLGREAWPWYGNVFNSAGKWIGEITSIGGNVTRFFLHREKPYVCRALIASIHIDGGFTQIFHEWASSETSTWVAGLLTQAGDVYKFNKGIPSLTKSSTFGYSHEDITNYLRNSIVIYPRGTISYTFKKETIGKWIGRVTGFQPTERSQATYAAGVAYLLLWEHDSPPWNAKDGYILRD